MAGRDGFARDHQGRITTSLESVRLAVPTTGREIAWDEFRDRLVVAEPPGTWRDLDDVGAVRLRVELEKLGFAKRIRKELVRAALAVHGDAHRFDSAKAWLAGLPAWDGRPRVGRFCPDYLATEDAAYTRAVGLYVWTAHAGRVLEPGCKADLFPVLVGPEGVGKSMAVAAIAPEPGAFAEFDLSKSDADLGRLMRGVLVGELPEPWGLRTRARSRILVWISRAYDEWRPKYQVRFTRLPRRSLLWGTTVYEDFFSGLPGERRWLPLRIIGRVDVDAIRRDRLQLWAEARDLFMRHGVAYEVVERQIAEQGERWLR